MKAEDCASFGKKRTMADTIRSMTEEELADCFLNFPKENIVYKWCSELCFHRIREPYNKCGIDLEKNPCPCDTKDIVIHWLKSEVKE